MTHEFKAALKRFDKHLATADPNATGKTLGLLVGAYFHDDEIVAIRKALKIAEKLMQEPSEEMYVAFMNEFNPYQPMTESFDAGIKSMRDQMLKEIAQND